MQKLKLSVSRAYSEGLLTEGERYNKVVDIWANVTEQVAESMFNNIAERRLTQKVLSFE